MRTVSSHSDVIFRKGIILNKTAWHELTPYVTQYVFTKLDFVWYHEVPKIP